MAKKAIEVKSKISNLYAFLKKADGDEYYVRTSYVKGGWHDNEFAAHAAGFDICRGINREYEARHEFSECYYLSRRATK